MTADRELAVLGGRPAFDEVLHVGRPNLGDREAVLARIEGVLDRRWLTNDGPLVRELESRIAELLGVAHVVVVANGTLGLELAVMAAGLKGEVIVPSYTFVATAHALRLRGLTPVFCDVDPTTHTLDPARVGELVDERTAAVVGVHLWGNACDVDGLARVATDAGIEVLYDAAHAFGTGTPAGDDVAMVGTFGRAEVFSFHATKFVNAFEGGAVTTDDADLAERLRLLRNFGFAGYDRVDHLGTNAKMPEVCAAMALTSLEAMDGVVARNAANLDAYRQGLRAVPGLDLVEPDQRGPHNLQYVVVEVEEGAALSRDELVAALWAENVQARRYFTPGCHRSEPYRSEHPTPPGRLPVTESLCERVLVLPTGTAVTSEGAGRIAGLIDRMVASAPRIRAALPPPPPPGRPPGTAPAR